MTSLRAVADGLVQQQQSFVIDAPEAWAQGRTLYGGLTAALTYEAVRRAHGEVAPLRSAQFTFVGPAAGRLQFDSTLLRRGRSATIIAAECRSDDGLAARSSLVFGAQRDSAVAHNFLAMPDVPAPDASSRFRKEAPSSPGFWNNFETRLASGARLLEVSAPRPEFYVWVRFREPPDVDPTTALLAMADCLPPAAMAHFTKPAPISTMTWTLDMLDAPTNADGWRLLWSASEHATHGYSMQRMAMWDEGGAPLATGRQAVSIFI